jgi:hypothetical protein
VKTSDENLHPELEEKGRKISLPAPTFYIA